MDVLLLKDVERLGAEGSIVSVKPGYARNRLIPSGLAVAATKARIKAVEQTKQRRDQKLVRIKEQALTVKRKLEGRSLALTLNLGADDKPFGSVTTHDLVQALEKEGFAVDRHDVRLEQPIKSLGIFEVPVRLHPEVTATLKVWVGKA